MGKHCRKTKISISGVPTSMQIASVAESYDIPLLSFNKVDIVFDGADQIDSKGYLIKGGGGALLRENILASSAHMIVIMADRTKFVKQLNKSVPVEIHPFAKYVVETAIKKMNGKPKVRILDRGYPFITENGNIILDCDFGTIKSPLLLAKKISTIAGVAEVGIFQRRPDIIYKAMTNNRFEKIKV
ncbi:MAG: ribose 5-phosphate isomerase A [Cenarchaeum symbiont of Oopsacas minuta]|nr:ribose 5-phosphate isomerase A [Cenarchaeum symbiont of Oopsacas minuta]